MVSHRPDRPFACGTHGRKRSYSPIHGARAIGRVCDQVFVILMTTTRQDDPILKSDALRIRINTATEQVSGNLF